MADPVPPWLLDADEILTVPSADLELCPVPVRLYVGDLEARIRELEDVCGWLRGLAHDLAWPTRHGVVKKEKPRNRAALVAADALQAAA